MKASNRLLFSSLNVCMLFTLALSFSFPSCKKVETAPSDLQVDRRRLTPPSAPVVLPGASPPPLSLEASHQGQRLSAAPSDLLLPPQGKKMEGKRDQGNQGNQGDQAAPKFQLNTLSIRKQGDGYVATVTGEGWREKEKDKDGDKNYVASLTLDPKLQEFADALVAAYAIPEVSLVLMNVRNGHILAYSSHLSGHKKRDLNVEATAPSASLFKIITASALVEEAHLSANTTQCYSGGEQRITASDLISDPKRDKSCATLATAMGKSLNTVFARLARANLTPDKLLTIADKFGYNRELPFDLPVQPSHLTIPEKKLAFERTSAGFWNSTLSPLHAAWLASVVARKGEGIEPRLVKEVWGEDEKPIYLAPSQGKTFKVIAESTASELEKMLGTTVPEGTCRKAFHDEAGHAYLPNVSIASKTGTLTDAEKQRFYTWFAGYGPTNETQELRNVEAVALSVLVVNGPKWKIKANVIARQMLQAYFHLSGVKSVKMPLLKTSKSSVSGGEQKKASGKARTHVEGLSHLASGRSINHL